MYGMRTTKWWELCRKCLGWDGLALYPATPGPQLESTSIDSYPHIIIGEQRKTVTDVPGPEAIDYQSNITTVKLDCNISRKETR